MKWRQWRALFGKGGKKRSDMHPAVFHHHRDCMFFVNRCEPMDDNTHIHYVLCLRHNEVVEYILTNDKEH